LTEDEYYYYSDASTFLFDDDHLIILSSCSTARSDSKSNLVSMASEIWCESGCPILASSANLAANIASRLISKINEIVDIKNGPENLNFFDIYTELKNSMLISNKEADSDTFFKTLLLFICIYGSPRSP